MIFESLAGCWRFTILVVFAVVVVVVVVIVIVVYVVIPIAIVAAPNVDALELTPMLAIIKSSDHMLINHSSQPNIWGEGVGATFWFCGNPVASSLSPLRPC